MSDICLMLKAIEFIEAHLTEEITIADVAESVSFSLFHFSRIFSRVMRHTPYDYLMRRRLSEAARCLLESDEKIIDVAFKYQFNAPETFSRAFKRMFNLQPRQVKLQQWLDPRQFMPKPTGEYLEFLNGNACLTPAAKKIPRIQLAGIATLINTVDPEKTISDLWDLFGREIRFKELADPQRDCYGVRMFLPSCPAIRGMYLAGISLLEGEEVPSFLVQKTISAMEYACFELPKQAHAPDFTRNYIYRTWWPRITNNLPPATFEIEYFSGLSDCQSRSMSGPLPKSLYFPLAIE